MSLHLWVTARVPRPCRAGYTNRDRINILNTISITSINNPIVIILNSQAS